MTEICVHNARNGQISDGALHYVRCNRKITGRRLFMSFSRIIIAVSGLFVLGIVPAGAQETTGPVGGPDATTTIDGRYLPPPPQPFKGTIGLNAAQSTPGRPALYRFPLDVAVLADPRGADHRPQSPLGRLWRDFRSGVGLPRL